MFVVSWEVASVCAGLGVWGKDLGTHTPIRDRNS